jgi:predicted transporter
MGNEGNAGLGLLHIAIVIFTYFIPWTVAAVRGHPNVTAIGLMNLLLGWTFLGWAIVFIWAYRNPRTNKVAVLPIKIIS